MDKAFILSEIKRTAKENGGVPLGHDRLKDKTGITQFLIRKYWGSNGLTRAQQEAGCIPNKLTDKGYDEKYLTECIIKLIREMNKFPTQSELTKKRNDDANFPSPATIFEYLGTKPQMAAKVLAYCQSRLGFEDVVKICSSIPLEEKSEDCETEEKPGKVGYVYLRKSHRRYKIGATYDIKRRDAELARQSAYPWEQIAVIETDDPFGVETYWKNRFKDKAAEVNEVFKLNSEDVKAFKRWRSIY